MAVVELVVVPQKCYEDASRLSWAELVERAAFAENGLFTTQAQIHGKGAVNPSATAKNGYAAFYEKNGRPYLFFRNWEL